MIRVIRPGLQGQSAALAALVVIAAELVVLLTFLGWWRHAGMNGRPHWRSLAVLILPGRCCSCRSSAACAS